MIHTCMCVGTCTRFQSYLLINMSYITGFALKRHEKYIFQNISMTNINKICHFLPQFTFF